MKKAFLILASVLVIGATLTSCDKDKNYCWHCTYTMATGEAGETYMWTSENLIDQQKTKWSNNGYKDIKCQKETKYKTQEECTTQNK